MADPLERLRAALGGLDLTLRELLPAGAADPLDEAGAATWIALDGVLRGWYRPSPPVAAAFDLLSDRPGPVVTALLACHHSGHVREAAVNRLAADSGRPAGPVLALRAADPVAEVCARRACADRIGREPASAFEALAPAAARLANRRAGAWLAAQLDGLLLDGPPAVLSAGLGAPDRLVRRRSFAVAIEADRLSTDDLVAVAHADRDQVVRVRCGAAAIRAARRDGDLATLRALLDVRAAAVRVEAVFALIRAGADDVARAALDDDNETVRALGRAALQRAGGDPVAHYRAVLTAGGAPPAGAIAALGEVGSAADAPLVREWLTDGAARRRSEAVRALRRLGAIGPDVLGLLDDPSAAVTRQVAEAVLRAGVVAPADVLLDRIATGPRHVRAAAHRVLRAQDVWTRLIADLRLLAHPDMAGRARADLLSWLERESVRTYSQPDPAQATELAELLRHAGSTFSADEHLRLRFHLGLAR